MVVVSPEIIGAAVMIEPDTVSVVVGPRVTMCPGWVDVMTEFDTLTTTTVLGMLEVESPDARTAPAPTASLDELLILFDGVCDAGIGVTGEPAELVEPGCLGTSESPSLPLGRALELAETSTPLLAVV